MGAAHHSASITGTNSTDNATHKPRQPMRPMALPPANSTMAAPAGRKVPHSPMTVWRWRSLDSFIIKGGSDTETRKKPTPSPAREAMRAAGLDTAAPPRPAASDRPKPTSATRNWPK